MAVLWGAGCATQLAQHDEARVEVQQVAERLPEAFAPLTWQADAASLRAAFPDARVHESSEERLRSQDANGVLHTTYAEVPRLGRFGPARVTLFRWEGEPLGGITVMPLEQREACLGEPHPPDCLNRWGEGLEGLFARLETELTRVYGAPACTTGFSNDESEDDGPCAPAPTGPRTLAWEEDDVWLELGIGQEPCCHFPFTLRLLAVRDGSIPYE